MSALGQKRTFPRLRIMSALPQKADIGLLLLPATQPDLIHPFDAVAHLPPELGIEPERHGDDAEDSHRDHCAI